VAKPSSQRGQVSRKIAREREREREINGRTPPPENRIENARG
jgi:hypothetical protein